MNGGEHDRRWLAATDRATAPTIGGDDTDHDTLPVNPSGKAELDHKLRHLRENPNSWAAMLP